MINLSMDFIVRQTDQTWTVEQFYYIHPGGYECDPESDTVRNIEPQCGFRPVYEFRAATEDDANELARQWLQGLREQVVKNVFLNEHPDGGYFTGGWDRQAGEWIRPLTLEVKRLTGCYAEFSRKPFPRLTYEEALVDVYERYGLEAIDRQLTGCITTSDAVRIYGAAPSSVSLACRNGDIAYAAKKGRDWSFPTVTFLMWLESHPGPGKRGKE